MKRTLHLSLVAGLCVLVAGTARAQQNEQTDIEDVRVRLTAQDKDRSRGVYYYRRGTKPTTAVLIMHPRGDSTDHFILEPLAKAGYGAMGMASRTEGISGIHEELLLDIAAGIKYLKSRGIENVVLAGHSGGGSLMAYYQAQAETAPPNRVKETPAGDPPNLNDFDLPKAAGLITLNAAEGEGLHIAHHLDPSVSDENDPFSYDPSLDLYHPDNGFKVPPGVTKYSPEFLARFEKAQQARAERLVEIARGYIREQNFYRNLTKSPGFKQLSTADQLMIERRAQFERPMLIYRTRADPRYFDLTIDPNDRTLGHYFAGIAKEGVNRSDLQNWSKETRLLTVTPRAFLSTESIASNARLWDNLQKITVPVLVVNSSADPGIHPSEHAETFRVATTKDKEKVWIIGGNHGFAPEGPKAGEGDQREQTTDALASWLAKRWPTRSTRAQE
jgi:pimeloyl-ACP methyl ester carboxylesterase